MNEMRKKRAKVRTCFFFSEEEKLRNLDMFYAFSSNPFLFILFYRFSACRKVKWYSVHRLSFTCFFLLATKSFILGEFNGFFK